MPSSREDFYYKLGCIFDVASSLEGYAKIGLVNLKLWVIPAIELDQVKIFYNEQGRPVAYVSWAYLTEEISRGLLNDDYLYLSAHQWLEGENFWIVDMAAIDGNGPKVFSFLKKCVLPDVGRIYYKRNRANGCSRSRVIKCTLT